MATACSSSAATGKKRKRVLLTTKDKLGVQTLKQTSNFSLYYHISTFSVCNYGLVFNYLNISLI